MWPDGDEWRIGCPQLYGKQNWHWVQTIRNADSISPELLKALVESGNPEPDYAESNHNCFFVSNRLRSSRSCGKFNIC